jgi:hypothetical protein
METDNELEEKDELGKVRFSDLDCSYYGLCFTTNISYASPFYVIFVL